MRNVFVFFLFSLLYYGAVGQENVIGRLFHEGDPLPGGNILVKKSILGMDFTGGYSLDINIKEKDKHPSSLIS